MNWPLIEGLVLNGFALILYPVALKFFPLNVVHPTLTSAATACVVILSVVVLGKELRLTMLEGQGFIVLGVFC